MHIAFTPRNRNRVTATVTANATAFQNLAYYCSANYNNDTANLRTLLGSLSSKAADNNTFYNDTSNNMYGLYLCRGDVSTDMCQLCVEAAIQNIQQLCQSDNRAIMWYDECMLRYSDTNFFGTVEIDPQVLMYNTLNISSPNDTNVDTLALMYGLASDAGTEPMMYYAHKELPATNVAPKNVSGMVQCSKDISGDECKNNCLGKLIKYAETCCQSKSGWRILAPSCNVRYEEYFFLTASVPAPVPPPVPPPAPTTTSKGESKEMLNQSMLIGKIKRRKVVLIITVPKKQSTRRKWAQEDWF
ncbi:unnamed protein product [Camellia sinensis]